MVSTATPDSQIIPSRTLKPFALADFSDGSTSTLLSGATAQSFRTSCSSPTSTQEVLHLQARRRQGQQSIGNKPHDVSVHVHDYHPPLSSVVKIHAVSASMAWKGEDRHCVSHNVDESSSMQAFAGVFDGHDGPAAAEYCAKGMLPHILLEMDDINNLKHDSLWSKHSHRFSQRSQRRSNSGRFLKDIQFVPNNEQTPLTRAERGKKLSGLRARIQPGYNRAFKKAQSQFAETGTPPTFHDVSWNRQDKLARQMKGRLNDGYCQKLMRFFGRFRKNKFDRNDVRQGGTTACTLSIVRAPYDRLLWLCVLTSFS
jgi:hypothetical protein